MIKYDFKKKIEDFCFEFGIAVSDVENRIFEMKPDTGNYFDETGSKTGTLMPFYFSAISLIIKHATNVLEIGDGFGRTTALLARLFPSATVFAIDIPSSDKRYAKLAMRVGQEKAVEKNVNRDNVRLIGETDVEPTIKYIKDIIGEDIKMLPGDMTSDVRSVAWFRKSASEGN